MPLFITQQQYDHAIRVLRGQEQLQPFFVELQHYLRQQFGIEVVDFCCQRIQNPADLDVHNKISVVGLAMQDVCAQFNNGDPEPMNSVNNMFVTLCKQHGFMRPDVLPYIGFENFVPIYKAACVMEAAHAAKPLLYERYKSCNIYKIISGHGALSVFFYTQQHVDANMKSGVCDSIKKDFYRMLKEADVLDWFSYQDAFIEFDSKEVLDRDYNGSLYHYYK